MRRNGLWTTASGRLTAAAMLGALGLLATGCGGGSGGAATLSIEDTKSCFRSHGYILEDRPELGFADVSADDWYDVKSGDNDVVTVAFFIDRDSVGRAKRMLAAVTKAASQAFGIEVSDSDIEDVVRTSGNYLYWWNGVNPTHEDDVEACMHP